MHLGGLVLDASIRMRGSVVKELVDAKSNVGPGAGGDGGGYGADGSLHGVVYGSSIVVEDAREFLAKFELCLGKLTSGTGMFRKLLCFAVGRGSVRVRRVLRFFWWGMAQSGEGLCYIIWHGEIDGAVFIVPLQVDATEDLAIMVDGDVIVLF